MEWYNDTLQSHKTKGLLIPRIFKGLQGLITAVGGNFQRTALDLMEDFGLGLDRQISGSCDTAL